MWLGGHLQSWSPPGVAKDSAHGSLLLPSEQAPGVLSDHQFLIGGDDPGDDSALRAADAWAAGVVGSLVQLHPEPGSVAADAGSDDGSGLAHAAREYQRVQPAQTGSQRPQLTANTVDEQ